MVDTWPHRLPSCWFLSEYHRHLCLSLWYWELRNICVNACVCVHACLCLSVWPPAVPFFLFMIGGVSANLPLIHHPAATGLSCDWTQRTLPPANMICRPKLDSYRLWQGYRTVWHNITHTQVCLDEFTVLTYAKTEMHPTALRRLCLNLKNRN